MVITLDSDSNNPGDPGQDAFASLTGFYLILSYHGVEYRQLSYIDTDVAAATC